MTHATKDKWLAAFGLLLCAVLFGLLSAMMAVAQSSGPVNTPLLNKAYYFVGTSPYATTIQSAVTAACAATHNSAVLIPAGTMPSDTIATVTGGCTKAWILDQRTVTQACYTWQSTVYSSAGVACGGSVIPTDLVTTDTTQTITGAKTFTAGETLFGSRASGQFHVAIQPATLEGGFGGAENWAISGSGEAQFGATATGVFTLDPINGLSQNDSSGVTTWSILPTGQADYAGSVSVLSLRSRDLTMIGDLVAIGPGGALLDGGPGFQLATGTTCTTAVTGGNILPNCIVTMTLAVAEPDTNYAVYGCGALVNAGGITYMFGQYGITSTSTFSVQELTNNTVPPTAGQPVSCLVLHNP